mmetsp:Transcript_36464/g.87675  ORF Transcript_36464/g.87675 Transcript_36464/m.87675 type:complete len:219 (-) Transcript_36464:350-1006(-)
MWGLAEVLGHLLGVLQCGVQLELQLLHGGPDQKPPDILGDCVADVAHDELEVGVQSAADLINELLGVLRLLARRLRRLAGANQCCLCLVPCIGRCFRSLLERTLLWRGCLGLLKCSGTTLGRGPVSTRCLARWGRWLLEHGLHPAVLDQEPLVIGEEIPHLHVHNVLDDGPSFLLLLGQNPLGQVQDLVSELGEPAEDRCCDSLRQLLNGLRCAVQAL